MKAALRVIVMIVVALCGVSNVGAQIVSTDKISSDSIREAFNNGPYFGLYKDNYFIFGTAVGGQRPSKTNTNIKFQISISQRLTKTVMPFNSYLFLFYSQKCFWNVLENSMPMTDLNFNPGIGLAKPLFVKNRFIGKVLLLLEHESNGRDGTASRSWNKISFGGSILVDPQFMVHAKFWIPIVDGVENKDILDYCGIYQMGTSFTSLNKRFGASVILTKRKGWKLNYNTVIELNYRLFKRDNQYLFLQYYNGYGEGLLAYKEFHSQLRVGIVIKPTLFSDY
ncbi:phospholipase A [uncultured Duncaniella sp.]|uniref:phospholipase A n=1 Tax=uncultured Duncaniella sp. TaxID=2768039 RepID=UPI002649AB2E|nr:phospholipase A [uncultured Duncaniella sp.]